MSKTLTRFSVLAAVLLLVAGLVAVLVGFAPAEEATAAAPVEQAKGETSAAYYIVQLADASLASYRGEVAGLAPTSPAALGSVRLDPTSPASLAYLDYLGDRQAAAIGTASLALGRDLDVIHQYLYVLNAYAVWLTPAEAQVVAGLPEVTRVWRDKEYQLTTDTGPRFIGAGGIWDGTTTGGLPGTRGEGVTVAIIDSGINIDHPSFAATGGDGYTAVNPLGTGNFVGWCDPTDPDYDATLVCNDKLIGLYSYPASGGDPEDDNGHGSHTASTTAGNVVSATVQGITVTISGVAPHANIIAFDVCTGSGCQGTSIVAAINDVVANANLISVINFSIGSATPSDIWNDADTLAFLDAFNAGVLPVTSAGNSGPNPSTVGSPADAPWMMAIANSTHGRVYAHTVSITGPGSSIPVTLTNMAGVEGTGPDFTGDMSGGIEYSGEIDAGNVEGCTAWSAGAFAGKIALISRGTCSFVDKVNNAVNAGAIGVIVHNNAGGPAIPMGGLEATTVPSVMVRQSDGLAMADWIANNAGATVLVTESVGPVVSLADADILSSTSSRGPILAIDVIKPDAAAPGSNILAAINTSRPGDPPEFGLLSGTSMASPHVAGSAALLRALYPSWSVQEIRSALMMSGVTAMLKQDAITPADPFDFGAGRINLAGSGPALLVMDESTANYLAADPDLSGDPRQLNLPSMQHGSCVGSCTWTRTLKNPTTITRTWSAALDLPTDVTGSVTPSSFDIGPGASQVITVTVDISALPIDSDWTFGQVNIAPGGTRGASFLYHMPIAVKPGSSTLPAALSADTNSATGQWVLSDMQALESTETTVDIYGLTRGTLATIDLAQDPTNGNAYDDLSQVHFFTVTVPANAGRMVVEIVTSEAPDIDLFWGSGSVPSAGTQLGASATGTAFEYLTFSQPPAGTYWVVIQNWEGSGNQATDTVQYAYAVVTADEGNLTVDIPASFAYGELFDVTISYDEPGILEGGGGHWYGYVAIGPNPSDPGGLGGFSLDVRYIWDVLYTPMIPRG